MNIKIKHDPTEDFKVAGSTRCYVTEVTCGSISCTWTFFDLLARQVCIFNGCKKVGYKGKYYNLHGPDEMMEIIRKNSNDGTIIVDGRYLRILDSCQEINTFHFFIITDDITLDGLTV